MTIHRQIEHLHQAARDLARCLLGLDRRLYLEKLNGWAPRDILAHLVGWNRAVVRGCDELRHGELPFYDVDPGESYSKVNAVFVRRHCSTDRETLLAELESTAIELTDYLLALDPDDWARGWGVRHGDELLTIRSTVDELIRDYVHHVRQIDGWVEELRRRAEAHCEDE